MDSKKLPPTHHLQTVPLTCKQPIMQVSIDSSWNHSRFLPGCHLGLEVTLQSFTVISNSIPSMELCFWNSWEKSASSLGVSKSVKRTPSVSWSCLIIVSNIILRTKIPNQAGWWSEMSGLILAPHAQQGTWMATVKLESWTGHRSLRTLMMRAQKSPQLLGISWFFSSFT